MNKTTAQSLEELEQMLVAAHRINVIVRIGLLAILVVLIVTGFLLLGRV